MKRKLFALLTAAAVTLTVSAAALDTVKLDGYGGSEAPDQLSISNVVSTKELAPAGAGGSYAPTNLYTAEAPCTLTLTDDYLSFDVIPCQLVNGEWTYVSGLDEAGYENWFDALPVTDAAGCTAASVNPEEADGPIEHLKGCSVTLSEPGVYFVMARYAALDGQVVAWIDVGGNHVTETPADGADQPAADPQPAAAKAATAKVLVDGKEVAFNAYEIAGNNYFKLRDLAMALNGSAKQFEVSWDEAAGAIALTSGKAYTAVGGELAQGDGADKAAKASTASVSKDGAALSLAAYEIADNNYFKLRDVAKAFDIGIGWDDATQTITVDTAASYVEG